jgi:hypothetical protein
MVQGPAPSTARNQPVSAGLGHPPVGTSRWLLRNTTRLAVSVVVLLRATTTFAQDAGASEPSVRRGPPGIRDEQLLAQPRLTLPALSPDTLGRGDWTFGTSLAIANTFSYIQNVPGELPGDRRFLIDGEAWTADFTARRGLSADLDVSARLPVRWRGGGILDGLIDTWHRLLHLPDNGRPLFRRNAFRVEGITTSGQNFSWNDERGLGLGELELEGRWRFRNGGRDGWSLALAGRAALPTATAPFDGNGVGLGVQVVAAHRLGSPFDLYLGAGGTAQGGDLVRGVGYERYRGWGFLAVEWRLGRRFSLVAETDAASRLIRNIDLYPGMHWIIHGSGWMELSQHARMHVGFTEKIKNLLSNADFGLHFSVLVRP